MLFTLRKAPVRHFFGIRPQGGLTTPPNSGTLTVRISPASAGRKKPAPTKEGSFLATEAKLRQLADSGCPVYYFYSSERYLVRQAVAAAVRVLSADSGEEATVLDGAAPELEQLIMAAGTISFFRHPARRRAAGARPRRL